MRNDKTKTVAPRDHFHNTRLRGGAAKSVSGAVAEAGAFIADSVMGVDSSMVEFDSTHFSRHTQSKTCAGSGEVNVVGGDATFVFRGTSGGVLGSGFFIEEVV